MCIMKVFATIWVGDVDKFENLATQYYKLGIDTFRFNCARHDSKKLIEEIVSAKRIYKKITGTEPQILLDIPLPRTKRRIQLVNGENDVNNEDELIITCDEIIAQNNINSVLVNDKEFVAGLNYNDIVAIGDGNPSFKVIEKKTNQVKMKCCCKGSLRSKKSIYKHNDKYYFYNNDIEKYRVLIEKVGPQSVALSFVEKSQDIDFIRSILQLNPEIRIISKIESEKAVNNIEDILTKTDEIMIARGDLFLNSGIRNFAKFNEYIISACQKEKVPFSVATGILEKTCLQGVIQRSEIIDVYNFVSKGASAAIADYEISRKSDRIGRFVQIINDITDSI